MAVTGSGMKCHCGKPVMMTLSTGTKTISFCDDCWKRAVKKMKKKK